MAELKRRKILYLTNRVPYPPDKGDRIRTFHQIDRLALRHDVYCATFTETASDAARVSKLRRWCRDVLAIPWQKRSAVIRAGAAWLRGGTLTHGAYANPILARQISRWAERQHFDIVVCFSSIMAPYADLVPAKRKILDLCDIDSEKWSDYARSARFPFSRLYGTEARRLATYEQRIQNDFDETIVITQRERRLIDAFQRDPNVHVISNGVNRVETVSDAAACGPVVGFLGTMNYKPNVDAVCWFANSVWPLIHAQNMDAQFVIIGRSPTRRVRRLGRRPGISVTGGVRDMRTHLDRCRLVVAPLRVARGLPNKMIEAMAAGRPVVATASAADCLNVEAQKQLLVGDTPEEFAASVARILQNDDLCRRLASEALEWVAANHDWDAELDIFERVVLGNEPVVLPARMANTPTQSESNVLDSVFGLPTLADVRIGE
ncbi:MAG: TIGR03087 family PEP-CTERM/XrtA system glycosyltransferase [Phycisphaerales bacterium]|nr:TIGR03087 family PEP-CTERM/XrtA system glycosyltransferase [Phycisphaerales bacterium]